MIEHIEETIPEALDGLRIDRVIALVADISRTEASSLLAAGSVLINDAAPTKPSDRVAQGQVLQFDVERKSDELIPDPSVIVPVVFEDEQFLVVDKPAGMIVHPGSGASSGTMAHGLIARYPEMLGVGDKGRPGIVHRLDKGTSGLLLVARTAAALESLSAQLGARSVLRRYISLVWGRVASAEGLIDAPLGRSPRDATRQAVVAGGRVARTRYEVLESFIDPEATLISCRLETGRTHQIRVHLDAIGHPVVGDDRYGKSTDDLGLGRPFLHAETLGFEHPETGQWMQFSSELPADLADLLAECQTRHAAAKAADPKPGAL